MVLVIVIVVDYKAAVAIKVALGDDHYVVVSNAQNGISLGLQSGAIYVVILAKLREHSAHIFFFFFDNIEV